MSHFFLFLGQGAETHAATAARFFQVWKRRQPDATQTDASFALVVAGSVRKPASIAPLAVPDGRPVSLAIAGHTWPRDGHTHADAASSGDILIAAKALRDRTEGVYGLAIVDERAAEAVVCCDHLGSFHLYYRALGSGIAVCSSPALLAMLAPTELDPVGVQEFVSSAVPNENRSLWQGIRKLRGGEMLIARSDGSSLLESYRPLITQLARVERKLDDAVQSIHAEMGRVLPRLAQDGFPVSDLTGGNDSRALTAALIAHGIDFAVTVSGPPMLDDVRIAHKLATKVGLPFDGRPGSTVTLYEALIDALRLTDGEFDAVEFCHIEPVHRQHIEFGYGVSLNGSYGETARGYPWRLGPKAVFRPDALAGALSSYDPIDAYEQGRKRFKGNDGGIFANAVRIDWDRHGGDMIARLQTRYPGLPQCALLDLVHIDLRMERWQGRIASSTNQIWPATSPWGFQSVLPLLLTTHPLARRNSLLSRAYTAFAAPALADEPLFTGNPARPFSWGKAHTFAPAVGWYAKRAKEKLALRLGNVGPPLSPQQRQPLLFKRSPLHQWLKAPLLLDTGLFERDALLKALDPTTPKPGFDYTRWCRLLTLELLLRLKEQQFNVETPTQSY